MQLGFPPAENKSSQDTTSVLQMNMFSQIHLRGEAALYDSLLKTDLPNSSQVQHNYTRPYLFFEAEFCKSGPEFFHEYLPGALGNSMVFMKPIMYGVKINVLPSLEGKLEADGLLKGKTATSSPAPPLPCYLFSKAFILV